MDAEERATVIGHLTLASNDLKSALKSASKMEGGPTVGQHVQTVAQRLGKVLEITGVQLTFGLDGAPQTETPDSGDLWTANATPTTGRPLLPEGGIPMRDLDLDGDSDEASE